MHPSPNILRSTVIGCEAKYTNGLKEGLKEELFVLKSRFFGQEKGHICYMSYFRQ